MFADASPAAQSLLDFTLIVALLASIGGNIALIYSTRSKARREITFGFIPAAKEEFDRHVAWDQKEHDHLFAKLGGVERGAAERLDTVTREWRALLDSKISDLLAATDQGREKLHDRIHEILKAVSRLEGKIE